MFQCLNIKSNMLEHLVNVLCGKHKCSSNYTCRFGGCSMTSLSNFFAIFSRILFSYSFSSIPFSNLCQTSPSFSHLSSLCNTSGVTTSQFRTSCSFSFPGSLHFLLLQFLFLSCSSSKCKSLLFVFITLAYPTSSFCTLSSKPPTFFCIPYILFLQFLLEVLL